METEIENAIHAIGKEAQYDEKAKHLLGNKIVLAHILVGTVAEFKGMNPEDVASYIEGKPYISEVPVEPGLTNHAKEGNGQRLYGMNTENTEINEGIVRFDIVFYVRMKDGLSQIIVNVEAQKDMPAKYKILNRAVFYVCRLVSSQKERDFVHMDYDSIKRVYSIWLCMNMDENSMSYIHLKKEDLLGSAPWKGGLDLLNIVMVGIANELPGHDEKYGLHRLLGTLFSEQMEAEEKLDIMGTEYGIPADDNLRKDVGDMCNLSEGILEKGMAKGRVEGKIEGRIEGRTEEEKKIILNMHNNNFTLEQIALATGKSVREIEIIIDGFVK